MAVPALPVSASPMHTREMANMQRQLQQTNAALRIMQQQRRQGTAERVQRLCASPAAVAGSFSHLWEMDAIEKKIRAQEQQQQRRAAPRESVPDGSRCEASAVSEPSGVRPPTRPTHPACCHPTSAGQRRRCCL